MKQGSVHLCCAWVKGSSCQKVLCIGCRFRCGNFPYFSPKCYNDQQISYCSYQCGEMQEVIKKLGCFPLGACFSKVILCSFTLPPFGIRNTYYHEGGQIHWVAPGALPALPTSADQDLTATGLKPMLQSYCPVPYYEGQYSLSRELFWACFHFSLDIACAAVISSAKPH